ncbi:MAG: DUF6508 domain-containing protein [Solirubrobacteraceae bacterium]
MPDLTHDNAIAIIEVYEGRLSAEPSALEPAEEFATQAAALGMEELGFDWQAWPPARSGEVNDPAFIAAADPQTLRLIMTTHLRMNRYEDGHLLLLEERGTLANIVARLQELVQAGEI